MPSIRMLTMTKLNRTTHPVSSNPERVLQFGTGVLLRGLVDYQIDKANKQGLFNGSVVIVKSTGGTTDEFARQDNLYSVAVRGVRQGQSISENTLVTSVSRVLSAQTEWRDILNLAKSPSLRVIVSNTTEVGLQYVEESIFQNPPQSFAGKLTAFLYERFKDVGGSRNRGLVVIPTELVVDNGLKLRDLVERLAAHNELGKLFTKWLKFHVRFCNSLVDRIVPGKPEAGIKKQIEEELGYEDDLLTMTEPYHLWAIEGDDRVKEILSFAGANPNTIVIDEDITFYRERKLRVLNGSHTISVPLAYLLGHEIVLDMIDDPFTSRFIEEVMQQEIVPTVPADDVALVKEFADEVLDRFRNPSIEHLLLNITVQESAKMQARNVTTLQRYYELFNKVPDRFALGFAAYLRFMKVTHEDKGTFYGEVDVAAGLLNYPVKDDRAAYYYGIWPTVQTGDEASVRAFVEKVCSDKEFWKADLSALPGWVDAVSGYLFSMLNKGVRATVNEVLA